MDYTDIDRITFCGGEDYHSVYAIDIEQKIERSNITASIIMREYSSGNKRFYIPEEHEPPFKTNGKFVIASNGGEVVCNEEITKTSSGTVGSMNVMRYKAEDE